MTGALADRAAQRPLHARPQQVTEAAREWLAGKPVPTLEEFFRRHGRAFRNYRYAWAEALCTNGPDTLAMMEDRWSYIREFGFSIPTAEALDLLARHASLVELGAGTGFIAAPLAQRGVEIEATDIAPCGKPGGYGFTVGAHRPTLQLEATEAVRRFPGRDAFCSWPSLNESWLADAARAMHIGRALIVVREAATANEATWLSIGRTFREEASLEIPCFVGLHDRIEVWRKYRDIAPPAARRRPL